MSGTNALLPVPAGDGQPVSSPFAGVRPPRHRSWLERLLRRPTPELAEQALAALFASGSPHKVGESRVAAILTEHRAFDRHARAIGNALLRRALLAFLQDHALSPAELAYLERLVRLLHIGFDDAERITLELTKPIYEHAVANAAADHVVSDEERTFLGQLVENLRLPPEVEKAVRGAMLGGIAQQRFNEMLADRRFTPAEFAELETLARNLGTDLTFDEHTQNQLRRYALLWQVEHGELPSVDAPIALQKGEVCHFQSRAVWHELRTRVQRIGYHGPVVSIPIIRGLRYRIGSVAPTVIRSEALTPIDDGDLYLTNKRVIFNGTRRNSTIRLSNLISFQVFSDGLALEKGTGRSPHFALAGDAELAATILSTLLAQPGK